MTMNRNFGRYAKQDMSPEERFEKYCEKIGEKLIKQIESGTAPWQRPWKTGFGPCNGSTLKCYNGMNQLALSMAASEAGYEDPRWLTYKQAQAMGAQVKKGERGTQIWRPILEREVIKRDENGQPVLGEDGNPIKVKEKLEKPYKVYFTVFNAQQIDKMPPLPERLKTKIPEWESNRHAENILQASGAKIVHKPSDRAFYNSGTDTITLPDKGQFQTQSGYYSVALHELGHWTGHASRLNRKLGNKFGSEDYAKEELRAEISSLMLEQAIGLEHNVENHASYVQSWIRALKDDPEEIYRACKDAGKIRNFVLSFDQTLTLEEKQALGLSTEEDALSLDDLTPEEQQVLDNDLAQVARQQVAPEVQQPENTAIYKKEYAKVGEMIALFTKTPEEEEEALKLGASRMLVSRQHPHGCLLPPDKDIAPFEQWTEKRYFLNVEHTDNMQEEIGLSNNLLTLGAKRDEFYNWYVPDGIDLKPFDQWLLKEEQVLDKTVTPEPEVTISEVAERNTPLTMTYKDKDIVKALGAKFNPAEKQWYVPKGESLAPFEKWLKPQEQQAVAAMKAPQDTPTQQAPATAEPPTPEKLAERKTYLALPYEECQSGKKLGAKWDPKEKLWYVPEGKDLKPFEKWMPKLSERATIDLENARGSLKDAIERMGGVVPAGHPRMEINRFHRIPADGAPHGQDFAYSIKEKPDGTPVAYLKNWRTGETAVHSLGKTFTKHMSLSDQALAAQQRHQQKEDLTQQYTQTAEEVQKRFSHLEPITKTTAYMARKGIEVSHVSPGGVKKDEKYDALVVPAYDLDGKQWTSQTIYDSGEKRFAKDSKKLGCCYVFGGKDCGNPKHLKEASNIILCEGFATAASLFKAAPNGTAVVVAFDVGNMETVAKEIAQRYPQTPKLIAADDDYAKTLTGGKNVGREKGEQIAKEIGAACIVPAFKPEQRNFPADVPKFTPEDWSRGLISAEQRKAYENIKSFSDFNDLERVDQQSLAWQVGRGLSEAINKQTERNIRQQQTQERQKTQNQEQTRGRSR